MLKHFTMGSQVEMLGERFSLNRRDEGDAFPEDLLVVPFASARHVGDQPALGQGGSVTGDDFTECGRGVLETQHVAASKGPRLELEIGVAGLPADCDVEEFGVYRPSIQQHVVCLKFGSLRLH